VDFELGTTLGGASKSMADKKCAKGNREINFQEIQICFHLLQIDAMHLRITPNTDLI
jgi:hypothetical protein